MHLSLEFLTFILELDEAWFTIKNYDLWNIKLQENKKVKYIHIKRPMSNKRKKPSKKSASLQYSSNSAIKLHFCWLLNFVKNVLNYYQI